ncbi:MAG: DUF368 domain-containing protein [Flavobacteriales bacterium]|nr:DUF368 domain-containing protein [Flavobacteriales bacterium]
MKFNKVALMLKGAAMGIAETIPGVSGGTLAFITGIYERLINSIKSFHPSLFSVFKKDGIAGVWKKIDGNFLLFLVAGMGAGLVIGTKVFSKLLESFPLHLWAFFFGLIIASAYMVGKEIKKWNALRVITILIFSGIAYAVTISSPTSGSTDLWLVFISGAIAVSALMLPGLSGSFILLLMGMYSIILPTFKELLENPNGDNIKIILVFIAGCATGMLTFVHLLSWTYKNYREQTLAALTGFLIGSLNKLWPWQEVLSTRVNSHGETVPSFTQSISPASFGSLSENIHYGTEPHTIACISLMIGGIALVLILDRLSAKNPE